MSLISTAFYSISKLRLWFNDRSNIPVTLADVPEIIPLRWPYFKDNWEFIVEGLKRQIPAYRFPDMLADQIEELSRIIKTQRNSANQKTNPFSKATILNTYYAVWESIPVSNIPLTKEESNMIDDRLRTTRRYTGTDFLKMRVDVTAARDEISDIIGLSDDQYNTTFNRASVAKLRDARIKDITSMKSLQQSIKSLDFILANIGLINTVSIDPFALARLNANNPDIDIQTARSSSLARMFYGDSLQAIAGRYLGNPDRWIEIAIANGLKPPYIDEIGTTVPLLSNGQSNQINLSALDGDGKKNIEKLYINQPIFIQSNTIRFPDQRTIINIREVPVSGEIVLELSGDQNLDVYTIIDGAHIRIYKPNTINSNFLISIPSPDPVSVVNTKDPPFFLSSKREDEKQVGVDLLLDDSNDLVFNAASDFQLSYGLANGIQAMKLKFSAEQGGDRRHPDFGLPVIAGKKIDDPDAVKNLLVSSINRLVNADPRFERVETINVRTSGPSAIVNVVVSLAGSGTKIPISFKVNTAG